jgi:crotonobetainyl-CoA:carnitine CoA-transferase CaiB-like acyl-CoA transferase
MPDLGEHSEAVLSRLGYSAEEIEALEEDGII